MQVVGETGLDGCFGELAYAVPAAGLAKGGANAEFLFLQARSLPLWASFRREGCIHCIAGTGMAGAQHRTGWKNSGPSERGERDPCGGITFHCVAALRCIQQFQIIKAP